MTADEGTTGASSPPPTSGAAGEVDLGLPQCSRAVEIGRGASGVVYRAEQPGVNRTVAVKMLPFAALDETARRRFERECRAMGALSSHPGIVPVYDAGFTAQGQPYIIMEFMDGGSLTDRLARGGRLGWEEAVEIGVRLAGALAAAHQKGVLHRDIKPENVLISTYGEPKLADFSIARLADASHTATGLVSATPAHAAPEILRGDPPTERADVYSLGSTILTLLLGQAAFVRATDSSIFPVLNRVASDPVPDLRPYGVPDQVCRVLERAMAKDPAWRQASATQFADELRSARDAAHSGVPSSLLVPPPISGATMVGGTVDWPAPAVPAATATGPPTASGGTVALPGARPAGPGRRTLLIALAVLVLAGGGGTTAVLLSHRGGPAPVASSTAATHSGASSPSASAPASEPPAGGDLSGRLLVATDLPAGFSAAADAKVPLDNETPCNHAPSLDARVTEADAGFAGSDAVDLLALKTVSASLAQFQPGGAAKYLDELAAAATACKEYTEDLGGGQQASDTIAVHSGPQLGDQTVRLRIVAKADILTITSDLVGFRRGDVVAVVIYATTATPDDSTAEALAHTQAQKLG